MESKGSTRRWWDRGWRARVVLEDGGDGGWRTRLVLEDDGDRRRRARVELEDGGDRGGEQG